MPEEQLKIKLDYVLLVKQNHASFGADGPLHELQPHSSEYVKSRAWYCLPSMLDLPMVYCAPRTTTLGL